MDQIEGQSSTRDLGLQKFAIRFNSNVKRDSPTETLRDRLIHQELDQLRNDLDVDRVVVYYFYYQWKGQVTFESLRDLSYSIYGSTGADDRFNDQYASHYKAGKTRAIHDVETEDINPCPRDFLRSIAVKSNIVFPIVVADQLWGLLIAHQCQTARIWSDFEREELKKTVASLQVQLENFNLDL